MRSLFPNTSSISLLLCGILLAGLLSGCASREEKIQSIQQKAESALLSDKTDQGLKILRKGLSKFPDSNTIRIALSRALLNTGELEEAAQLLEEAIAQDPEREELWVQVGDLRVRLGQSEAAVEAFDTYLKNHASDFLAWKAISLEYEKQGKFTSALSAATKWNELAPSAQPAYKLGQLYLLSNNVAQARSWLGQAAAYPSGTAAKEAMSDLIKLESDQLNFPQAKVWLDNYDSRYGPNTNDPRIVDSRAIIEEYEKREAEIVRLAQELEAERQQLEMQRLASQQNIQPAVQQTKPVETASNPNLPIAAEKTAPSVQPTQASNSKPPLALFGDGEPAPGNEPAATTSSPEPAAAQVGPASSAFEAALAQVDQGQIDAGIQALWGVLGENDKDPEVWHNLSLAYFAKSDWLNAEACALQARNLSPRSPQYANQYLRSFAKTQTASKAIEEIKSIRLLFPRDPDVALTLARTLREAGASRSMVVSAYRDYLALANRGHSGYAEANRYVTEGR